MNTLEELVSKYNINTKTASMMLDNYSKRMGTVNGDFKITDITYKGFECKSIELTCVKCGKVIQKDFINGKNKWSELIKNCDCENKKSEKNQKTKKGNKKR